MFNKKQFNEKLGKIVAFLEQNKNKAPTAALKAEFSFLNNEMAEELGELEPSEYQLAFDEMRRLFSNKEIYQPYSVYHKMHEAEQKKNKWNVVIN